MKPQVLIALAAGLGLTALGAWLWWMNGVPVWLTGAMALCT